MEINIDEVKKQYPEYKSDKINGNFYDRTGMKYGRLKVLYRTLNNKNNDSQWVCLCDCGTIKPYRSCGLSTGRTQSCGCYKREQINKAKRKYNTYDLSGTYGIGYTTNTNVPFYFDKEDYDLIKDLCWIENDQGYIISTTKGNGVEIRLHRLIMNIDDEKIIDHKNNNRADNRKNNLRIANKQTNGINRGCNKNNKLGIKGVNKITNSDKYAAKIMHDGKTIHLGSFNTIEEAQQARIKAEEEMYGEFAYINP